MKAVSDTLFDIINTAYRDRPLIFIRARSREKPVLHHQAMNEVDSCLNPSCRQDKSKRENKSLRPEKFTYLSLAFSSFSISLSFASTFKDGEGVRSSSSFAPGLSSWLELFGSSLGTAAASSLGGSIAFTARACFSRSWCSFSLLSSCKGKNQ